MVKKIIKIFGYSVLFISLLIGTWWLWPAYTPSIKGENSVSSLEYIKIGGIRQSVLIRSQNKINPIMLFLHGGPGMPMMYLAHRFQRPLEKYFTVVQWDQRGSGRTYTKGIPDTNTINIQQYLSDAKELIDTLQNRYGKVPIILVAHSFGTYLGSILASRYPNLIKAYVSVGQVVDDKLATPIQEAFIREAAIQHNNKKAFDQINKYGKKAIENWLFEFGGELKNSKSFMPLLWAGLCAPEYTVKNALDVAKGPQFCNRYMKYNVLQGSILEQITTYSVPVYFIAGTSDYTTPFRLIEKYYNTISAPHKELIWFNNSAHFPFFEEPKKFTDLLIAKFAISPGK